MDQIISSIDEEILIGSEIDPALTMVALEQHPGAGPGGEGDLIGHFANAPGVAHFNNTLSAKHRGASHIDR